MRTFADVQITKAELESLAPDGEPLHVGHGQVGGQVQLDVLVLEASQLEVLRQIRLKRFPRQRVGHGATLAREEEEMRIY